MKDFKKRVVFVDIDGPMLPYRVDKYHPQNGIKSPTVQKFISDFCIGTFAETVLSSVHFDPVAVGMLNQLHESYPYEIVISSSWAHVCNDVQMTELFRLNGLAAPFHREKYTPKKMSSGRGHEISWWLAKHIGYEYIILDDKDSFHDHAGFPGLTNMVIVDPEIGLENKHYGKMVNIFLELP